jgi:hypothetical protein
MSATLGGAFGFFVLSCVAVWCFGFCAGIRDMTYHCTRRPCAGRHLLFFAAAKKSRQKKAAHTASSSICLRAPKGSYTSHGNHVTHARCQRSCSAHHPLHAPALPHAAPDSPPPHRWQTVCRPLVLRTPHSGPIAHASPCKSDRLYDATTCTQFAAWAAHTIRCRMPEYGCLKRVRRSFEALAMGTNEGTAE